MKRKKTLLILCVVLVVAVIAIVAENALKQHIDKVNTIDEEVFALDEDDLTGLTISYGNDEIILEKSDGTWTYTGDSDFPVDQDYVADMLSYFESVHASFIIDDVTDYSQYGLSSPEASMVFTTEEDENTITFGTFSTIDEKRYICVDGGSVYLIDEDLLEYVSASVADYLDRDEVKDYYQLTAMTVSGDGALSVTYDPDTSHIYTDNYDYYYVSGNDYLPLSEDKVLNYLNTLETLDLSEYVTYKADESDLSKYGLDSPSLTIAVTGEVSAEDTDDSDAVESVSQTIYVSSQGDEAYVYFEGSTIIYTISSDVYDTISAASYETMRPSEIVSIDWTKVSKIIIDVEDTTYTVAVEYDKNDGNTYTVDDETVDFVTVTSKIDGLILSEVGENYELGDKELSFTITLSDDEATDINVAMYQYDGDYCVVTADGKTEGLCSRSSMSNLREEIISAILNAGKEESE